MATTGKDVEAFVRSRATVKMPTLYVSGGANGVGKTRWYQLGVENKSINPGLPFVNIDLIVLRELGGYTAENLAKVYIGAG
jgi:hypothetical protein